MITTKDIAALCNLSRGTVDRALNGRGRISEKTRQKVLAVAYQNGYRPDLLARALVKGRSYTLGVVVFDLLNRYFAQIINSAEQEARRLGFNLNITLTQMDAALEYEAIERLVSYKADGLLLHPIGFGAEMEALLESVHVPIVTIGNRVSEKWSYVGIDDYKAAADGAKSLLHSPYDLIVFNCPPLKYEGISNVSVQRLRLDGFLSVMKTAGRPYAVWIENSAALLDEAIASGKRVGMFCSSDSYVLRFIDQARNKGYSIPDQLGLMGFDNIDTFQYLQPSIASIGNPLDELGRRSILLLVELIGKSAEPHTAYLPHALVPGGSMLFGSDPEKDIQKK